MDAHYDSQKKPIIQGQLNKTQHSVARRGRWEPVLVAWERLQCEWEEWPFQLCLNISYLWLSRLPKKLLEAAIPEVGQVLAGRKRPSRKMLKHVAETAAEKSLRTSGTRLTAGRAATPGARAARGRAGVAEPRLTGTTIRKGRKSVPPAALSSYSSSLLSKTPKTIYKRNPAKRSRSDTLSEIQFRQNNNKKEEHSK